MSLAPSPSNQLCGRRLSSQQASTSQPQLQRKYVGRGSLTVKALLKQAPGVKVTWTQAVDEVKIKVPVSTEARGRDIKFDVHPKRLTLTLDGKPLLSGSLEDVGRISVDTSYWTLESETDASGEMSKHVAITLGKATSGHMSWDKLLESENVDMTITDRCFLEVSIGEEVAGKIAIGLYGNACPLTVANFVALCKGDTGLGEKGKPLHFKGSPFHRIIPGFMAQGGDITAGDGTGGDSIYGPNFADENFGIRHEEAGMVAMANAGPSTNSSQFYILFNEAPFLNGKHVVFGKVVAGMDIVRRMEAVGTGGGPTTSPVSIVDCGILADERAVDTLMKENKMLQLSKSV